MDIEPLNHKMNNLMQDTVYKNLPKLDILFKFKNIYI